MWSFSACDEHLWDRIEKLLSRSHTCTAEQELKLSCSHERHRVRGGSGSVTVRWGVGAPQELVTHLVLEKMLPAE